MSDLWKFERANASAMPNMASWQATNNHNQSYLVQASWPLGWPDASHVHSTSKHARVVYTTDGNAMFMSATDVVRRRQASNPGQIATIVIAISYLITNLVYSTQRNYDLTPPSKNYTAPPFGPTPPSYGGADDLLHFITKDVNSFVFDKVFPHVSVNESALFGHSLGGLFALHTLYTAPESFDTYLAASPSIWWNDRFILQEEQRFHQKPASNHHPNVFMSYGTLEQYPERVKGQSAKEFAATVMQAEYVRMADNVNAMYQRLASTRRIKSVKKRVFQDEDHPTVVAGALSGALYWWMGLTDA